MAVARYNVCIALNDAQLEALKAWAAQHGCTVSGACKRLVVEGIAQPALKQ